MTLSLHRAGSSSESSLRPLTGSDPQSTSLSHTQSRGIHFWLYKNKFRNYWNNEIVKKQQTQSIFSLHSKLSFNYLKVHAKCPEDGWHVEAGHSGGSSLPSRQSGEKSHFHFIGIHFSPSLQRNISSEMRL